MRLAKIFVQQRCAKCPQAKQAGATLKEEGFNVVEYDVGTADGLAEASFYSVQATPTVIIEDQDETIVGDFRGEVPPIEALRNLLAGM